jgi:hypothetical protein
MFRFFQRLGVNITPNHYYQPIPDLNLLKDDLWQKTSQLLGIAIYDQKMLDLLKIFQEKYQLEYEALPRQDTGIPGTFYLYNRDFGRIDAEVLYCMIRHLQPRKIIEIGSGHSTLLTAQTVLKNHSQNHTSCEFIAIEPYPRKTLLQGLPGLSSFIQSPVQEVPVSEFEKLAQNDILFIDSSHVLRIGGDVQYEYLEILPRLRKGVLVHIHDIFLPEEYPRQWIFELFRFWNEQYLLQAFLMFNSAFEVMWAGNYMCLKYPDELAQSFSSFDDEHNRCGSFWIRKTK